MRTRLFNSEVYFLSSVSPAMEGIFLARRPVSLSLSMMMMVISFLLIELILQRGKCAKTVCLLVA